VASREFARVESNADVSLNLITSLNIEPDVRVIASSPDPTNPLSLLSSIPDELFTRSSSWKPRLTEG